MTRIHVPESYPRRPGSKDKPFLIFYFYDGSVSLLIVLASALGSSSGISLYIKDNIPAKKRHWSFQPQNSDWHKPRAPGKGSKEKELHISPSVFNKIYVK